ncbi:MAG TPA: VIT1/CCC1 transporter family protein [Acidimicrobiales bacterium]|jgi:VIT1/CCC1 family predicted Fe2+/Mn2+ transporter|nr:VIT1/CCC1 transporter family protein [Acidimicrobiales bacterium]
MGDTRHSRSAPPEHHHRNIRGGSARAAVFGISDGLVSNTSLVLGISGATTAGGLVRLAGLAGLLGGAFSMAAGEYISMRAQSELFEREIDIERREIERRPEGETRELAHLYERRGMEPELARVVAEQIMSNPDLALETHAREELGIDPAQTGNPIQAALSSFATFSVGALLPLLPFLVTKGTPALVAAVVLAAVAAVVVGVLLSFFTERKWWVSALRQLLICAAAGAVTYGIGKAVGVSAA